MIQLDKVDFKYNDNIILNECSVDIDSNITIITGNSGSGKTTLALTLNNINKIENGTIKILDYEINDKFKLKKNKMLRKDVAYVWQLSDTQLFNISVYDELVFNLKNFKVNVDDYKIEVLKYLTIFNLPIEILNMSPYHLSGGQKKKIAIISAILQRPKILILDEPTISLDPQSKIELFDILEKLEIKLIIITHDNELLNIIPKESQIIRISDQKLKKYENVKEYIKINFNMHNFEYIPLKYNYGNILRVDFEDIYNTSSDIDFVNKFGDICKIK